MVRVRTLALLTALSTTGALVPSASAQERPTAPISAKQRERERKAMSAFAAARYEDALNLYADLYADYHDPIYLRNIGRCHSKLKDPEKAIASFEEYLRRYKRITAMETDEVQSWIREMKGMAEAQTAPTAAPPPPPPTTTTAAAPTPAPVYQAPPPSATPPGATVPPQDPTQLSQAARPAEDSNRTMRTIGIGALAAGGAALVAGGVFAALAWTKFNASENGKCRSSNEGCDKAADTVKTRNTLATVLLIGGAVAAAAGTTMIFVFPVRSQERTASLSGFGVGASWVY